MTKPMQNSVPETCHTNDVALKISHDLRGPVINIQGFSEELGNAVAEIAALIDRHKGSLPANFRDEISQLIEDDLNPCLKFLRSTVSQLDKRIDNVVHTYDVGNSNQQKGDG